MSNAQDEANRKKSQVRARIEHVFGVQQTSLGGRLVRTIGIARAKAKIGLQNLVYNIRRMITLGRDCRSQMARCCLPRSGPCQKSEFIEVPLS
jgi:hypothetical protein